MKKVLITGASGYIGSILSSNLNHYKLLCIDKKMNIFNQKIFKINLNSKFLINIVKKFNPNIVIHLAGESTIDFAHRKKKYLVNNINATRNLIKVLKQCTNLEKIIFSSTASVYSQSNKIIKETNKLLPKNNYALTKLKCENILRKFSMRYKINLIILRFFNVCGADLKNKLGELHDPETHLIPIVINKINNDQIIKIYGNNYNTKDGTCERDYIHVLDIVSAIKKLIIKKFENNFFIFNLGSGTSISVKKIINTISKILKTKPKLQLCSQRNGDVSKLFCSSKKIFKLVGWRCKKSEIKKIIKDEILWQNHMTKRKILIKTIY
jgi:UDP-glucose 4-epimerase